MVRTQTQQHHIGGNCPTRIQTSARCIPERCPAAFVLHPNPGQFYSVDTAGCSSALANGIDGGMQIMQIYMQDAASGFSPVFRTCNFQDAGKQQDNASLQETSYNMPEPEKGQLNRTRQTHGCGHSACGDRKDLGSEQHAVRIRPLLVLVIRARVSSYHGWCGVHSERLLLLSLRILASLSIHGFI